MNKLEGKLALITGGNSGIGLATAKEFVNEGAYVFITGRREQELAAAVKEIGTNVTGVQGDVANLGDLDRLFAQIKREKGKLDIVFANAGGAKSARLGKITEEHYHSIFDINVKGLLFTVQKALPLLPDGASIILNASIVASKGSPEWSVYSATKAAVRSFARTWTTDLKDRRIRVNAVSPGFTDTPCVACHRGGRATLEDDFQRHSTRETRYARGHRQGRRLSSIRRQQLHHGNGIVCGRRVCTGLALDSRESSGGRRSSSLQRGAPSSARASLRVPAVAS